MLEFGSTNIIDYALLSLDILNYRDYRWKSFLWEQGADISEEVSWERLQTLRHAISDYYELYKKKQLEGQYISVNPDKFPNDPIENYMCLFPHRSLIETSALMTHLDTTSVNSTLQDEPPDEFFMYFFKYHDILVKDIAFLYPVSKKNERKNGKSCTFATDLIKPIKNVAEVNPGMDFKRIAYSPSDIYISMPWLYNARTAEFIEISERYPEEFNLFTRTVEKIAQTTDNKFDIQKKLLLDLNDAKDNIRIACQKEKEKLAKRGIITFVGVAFTFFTITNPEVFEWITKDMAQLRAIVGAASLKETLFLLSDYSSLKRIGVDNPYSVILRWEEKTKKHHKTTALK
ncbi:MAG: hypothetical protein K6E30_08845 [Lachnospiraceae bacterium]|nr:hypothetical protein [Lachnospiraceae bacterium]